MKFAQMYGITTKLVSKAPVFLCESISQGILDLRWDPSLFCSTKETLTRSNRD